MFFFRVHWLSEWIREKIRETNFYFPGPQFPLPCFHLEGRVSVDLALEEGDVFTYKLHSGNLT